MYYFNNVVHAQRVTVKTTTTRGEGEYARQAIDRLRGQGWPPILLRFLRDGSPPTSQQVLDPEPWVKHRLGILLDSEGNPPVRVAIYNPNTEDAVMLLDLDFRS